MRAVIVGEDEQEGEMEREKTDGLLGLR